MSIRMLAVTDVKVSTDTPMKVIADAARVSHAAGEITDRLKLEQFITKLIGWEHWSPFEFVTIQFTLHCDRAIANELVRHRLASFMQESTRYVSYEEDIPFIFPCRLTDFQALQEAVEARDIISKHVDASRDAYDKLLKLGYEPEIARAVLPQCTATKLKAQMNLRELIHVIKLRGSSGAHPDMIRAISLLRVELADMPELDRIIDLGVGDPV